MKLFILFVFLASCQSPSPEVAPNPDELYHKFVEAYDQLDAAAITDLYTDGACLLNLYDGVAPGSLTGKKAIQDYFNTFFSRMKENNQQLVLVFKIASREKAGEQYMDNGFYQLDYLTPGEPAIKTFGKFSTILAKEQGEWKFKIDATTNTEAAEYESAEAEVISLRE